MKKIFLPIAMLLFAVQSFASFDEWFLNKTLRIDYFHSGNSNSESYSIDQVKAEPFWGGSQVYLIDTFNYGEYYVKAYDKASGTLLYSRGYSTLLPNGSLPLKLKLLRALFTKLL